MVFVSSEPGEHSITTRDIDVNENTIIQFEVRRKLEGSSGAGLVTVERRRNIREQDTKLWSKLVQGMFIVFP